jgi:hypothetical protein
MAYKARLTTVLVDTTVQIEFLLPDYALWVKGRKNTKGIKNKETGIIEKIET